MDRNSYEIFGKHYPIKEYAPDPQTGLATVPVIDIPMMSDYKWHKACLESRKKHPEQYAAMEDVAAEIAYLENLLGKMGAES